MSQIQDELRELALGYGWDATEDMHGTKHPADTFTQGAKRIKVVYSTNSIFNIYRWEHSPGYDPGAHTNPPGRWMPGPDTGKKKVVRDTLIQPGTLDDWDYLRRQEVEKRRYGTMGNIPGR